MVKEHHAVGHHVGVMVGQANDAGSQADVPGALGGGGDEYLGRRYRLPTGAMVLTDVSFIKAQGVQPLKQFQVPVQGQCRVFVYTVEGRHENSELHSAIGGHWVLLSYFLSVAGLAACCKGRNLSDLFRRRPCS